MLSIDQATTAWHTSNDIRPVNDGVHDLILNLHRANFDLWHEEDKARDKASGDTGIATAKRSIDKLNQQRNDTVEKIDVLLLKLLNHSGLPDKSAVPHTETPGMVIDRLSILTLKIYHTREEIDRSGSPPGHSDWNKDRLSLLMKQRSDLIEAFNYF